MISPLREELQLFNIKNIILSGDEARLILQLMGYNDSDPIITINPQQFKELVDSFDGITATKLMNRYKIQSLKPIFSCRL